MQEEKSPCLLLAVLHKDHKDLTDRIEALILQLHSDVRTTNAGGVQASASTGRDTRHATSSIANQPSVSASETLTSTDSAGSIPSKSHAPSASPAVPTDSLRLSPFAVIDAVASGSPGEADGLQLGDRLLQFGTVIAAEGVTGADYVQQVAQELQQAEDRQVQVVVLRQGEVMRLAVRPRQWQGRGLLG